MRSRATRLLLLAAVLVTGVTTPAMVRAGEPSGAAATKDGKARAAELFGKSADAYRQGDFKTAAELLEEAHRLDPQPVLLYNLARAREGMGDLDGAIKAYETFLEQQPDTKDRGAIEQRLVTIKRQRDEREALLRERERAKAESEQKKNTPPPPPPEPRKRSVLPYAVAGAGAAGLAAGAIFGVMATSKNSAAKDEPVQQTALDQRSSAEGLATVSTVGFIVGAVLVTAGVAWWFVDGAAAKKTGSAGTTRVGVTPGGLVLTTGAL